MKRDRFYSLDSLRGLAAIFVFFAHYTSYTLLEANPVDPYLFDFAHTFSLASMGVVVFFGLSSFLLSFVAERELQRNSKFITKNFYITRIFRILPLYVLYLVVLLFVFNDSFGWPRPDLDIARENMISNIGYVLFFVMNFVMSIKVEPGAISPFINESGHLWTLSVEMQFYAVFPLVFIVVRKLKLCWKTLLYIFTLGALFRTLFLAYCEYSDIGGVENGYLYFFTLSYFEIFMYASLLGIGFSKGDVDFFKKLLNRGLVSQLFFLSGILALGYLWSFYSFPSALVETSAYEKVAYSIVNIIIYGVIGFFITVVIFLTLSSDGVFVRVFLNNIYMRAIGQISYSIYIWHLLIKFCFYEIDIEYVSGENFKGLQVYMLAISYIFALLSVSCFVFLSVECPFNKMRTVFTNASKVWVIEKDIQIAIIKLGVFSALASVCFVWALSLI